MSLSSPWLLVLGLVLAVALVVAVVLSGRRRTAALAAAGITVAGRSKKQWGRWATVAGIVVLAFAFSGPAASLPVGREAGTVILAMDVSNSMGATDVTPTRLGAAQAAATSFIKAQPASVDIGVVGFDQGAITTSLPNADHTAALNAVQDLKVAGGTSLTNALLASLKAITGKTVNIGKDGTIPDLGYWGSATVVVFSDGEDQGQSDDSVIAAATAAQNAGIHIETVGVGTTAGTTVQVDGYSVHTALNQQLLTTIAQTTGGSYHPASDASQINGVASTIDLRLTVADEEVPLAGAFIAAALALLAIGAILTVGRTGRLV